MNRRMAGSFIIVLLVLIISIFNYRSNYIRIPMDESVKTAAKEQADMEPVQEKLKIPEKSQDDLKQGTSSSPNIDEKVQLPEKVADIKPPATKEVTIPATPVQGAAVEDINAPIPVSRGTGKITTDENKYLNTSKSNGIYGQFNYRDTSGGRIEIEPTWVEENIVNITLPGLNRVVQVHKEAADNFIQAFTYINNGSTMINGKLVPLLSLIRSMDGTFVSRHVNWNPARGLSNHSWGTAIDINASDHFRHVDPLQEPNDPNLILWEQAFKPAGFSWGNSYADAMHFELLK